MSDTFDYDKFLAEVETMMDKIEDPCWFIARDEEAAYAFAAWCVENGIEEPRIVIR